MNDYLELTGVLATEAINDAPKEKGRNDVDTLLHQQQYASKIINV